MDHFLAGGAGDDVVGAEIDGLLWANFLTHAAVDAAGHVDVEGLGAFLDLGPFVGGGDLAWGDFDGLWWADEFAELARDAALAVLLIGDESRGAAVVFRELVIPLLLRILHRDADAR